MGFRAARRVFAYAKNEGEPCIPVYSGAGGEGLSFRREDNSISERRASMTTRAKSGFFKSAFNAFVASRQRQADRYVAGALLGLDDKSLKASGYTREELSKRNTAYYI
jgi:hypothetical protein